MERLAQETWLHIFQFLSPSNTLRVSLTCKDWHVLWQDVTLWKPFHDAKFGGCPIPPLQPNDWMGSFKNVSAQLKIDSLSAQLRIGISTGRTVFVDRLLQEHPELFYPPLCVCGRPQFMDPHPFGSSWANSQPRYVQASVDPFCFAYFYKKATATSSSRAPAAFKESENKGVHAQPNLREAASQKKGL